MLQIQCRLGPPSGFQLHAEAKDLAQRSLCCGTVPLGLRYACARIRAAISLQPGLLCRSLCLPALFAARRSRGQLSAAGTLPPLSLSLSPWPLLPAPLTAGAW